MKTFLITYLFPIMTGLFLALMLFFPSLCLEGAKAGLLLWFQRVVPSLLPFMILTNFLTLSGVPSALFSRFRAGNTLYPFLLGLLCGYPMGAKLCADSVKAGRLSIKEGGRLLACCNLPSPMFLMGFLCTGLFSLSSSQRLLVLTAVYAPLPLLWALGGAAFSQSTLSQTGSLAKSLPAKRLSPLAALEKAMMESFEIIEKIGGYMMLFSILSLFIQAFFPKNLATLIFAGCLEMTTGSSLLAANLPFLSALSGALFFTVWGGFCIMAQTITVMKGSGLPFFPYFFLKLAHGILSALLIFLLLLL